METLRLCCCDSFIKRITFFFFNVTFIEFPPLCQKFRFDELNF